MPWRTHRNQPLLVGYDRHESGVGVRAVPESEGRVAAQYQLADLGAESGLQPQIQTRVLLAEPAQPRRQTAACECADEGEGDRAVPGAAHRVDRVDSVLHRGEDRLRMREECTAGLGEGHASPEPV